jgi:lipopolysaccharide transport system ATP-binding protein
MKPAIKVDNLSKLYRIGEKQKANRTLKEVITDTITAPIHNLRRLQRLTKFKDTAPTSPLESDTIWALKDISFEVMPGEVVGIIGSNGAGKSTLLKILSRITDPTEGQVTIEGRVGSLLEVGTGFHPELTGRENIYLNGAILGMTRIEINRKFEEIVDFAEIEKFIDTPVKYYSSGMYVRLAFSVAAHLEPEILLVDEVLSVGDAAFQKKCLGKIGEAAKGGRTILFISHNMIAVQALCERALLIQEGCLAMTGSAHNVIEHYLDNHRENVAERSWSDPRKAPGNSLARLCNVRLFNNQGIISSEINSDDPFSIQVTYMNNQYGSRLGTTVVIFNREGQCILSSISNHEPHWYGKAMPKGMYCARCHIPGMFLADGSYTVSVVLWSENYQQVALEDEVVQFSIVDSGGVRGDYFGGWSGVVRPLLQWETEPVQSEMEG